MRLDKLPTFQFERQLWEQGYDLVIGVDEVGRGSFAGPVVASAVSFPCHPDQAKRVEGYHKTVSGEKDSSTCPSTSSGFARNDSVKIDDSKRLKPNERKRSANWIKKNCLAYGIGEVGVATINKVGIGKATAMAMRMAIATLISNTKGRNSKQIQKFQNANVQNDFGFTKTFVLVDAFYIRYMRGIPKAQQKPIVKGDQKSISIAAASIVAKVYRDSLMQKFAKRYRKYGWGRNKGYGTREHQEAIKKNGITKLHRIMFVETFLRTQGHSLRG